MSSIQAMDQSDVAYLHCIVNAKIIKVYNCACTIKSNSFMNSGPLLPNHYGCIASSLPCCIDSSRSSAFSHAKFCSLLLYLVLLLVQFLLPVFASTFSIYECLIHRTFKHYRRPRSLRCFATLPWLQLRTRKLFSTQLLSLLHSPCALLPRILSLAPCICNFFRCGALHHHNCVSFVFNLIREEGF